MKINPVYLIVFLLLSTVLMSFDGIDRAKSIEGTWIRRSDHLMVKVNTENASILQDGDEKFPCDVSDLLIYKDIRKVKDNLWTCKFLVVTMGSCSTNYESGEMFINKQGELVIICPGFESKIYSKVNPRYNSSQD